MKHTTIKGTATDIKQRLERMFTPDVNFRYDKDSKFYFLTGITEAGKYYVSHIRKIRTKDGILITPSLLDEYLNNAQRIGLCTQIEEQDEDNTPISQLERINGRLTKIVNRMYTIKNKSSKLFLTLNKRRCKYIDQKTRILKQSN